tara:strand:- start:998 stop:1237 length:240 start_codon:yes stop_codon:yes gene_type:complete
MVNPTQPINPKTTSTLLNELDCLTMFPPSAHLLCQSVKLVNSINEKIEIYISANQQANYSWLKKSSLSMKLTPLINPDC